MSVFTNFFSSHNDSSYYVSGLNPELYSLYIYNKFLSFKKGIVVVANSLFEANDIFDRLSVYTNDVLFFPMDDFLSSEAISSSPELMEQRISCLDNLVKNNNVIIVTNLMGYLRYLPMKEIWKNSYININVNSEYNREELINSLFNIGYTRETIVNETGKVGIRGYVIDIFPSLSDFPIRIEFWGDTIESIKTFDVESQLTINSLDSFLIVPFSEFIVNSDSSNIVRKQKYLKKYSKNVGNILSYLNDYILFYYDYNQIKTGYEILLNTISDYDSGFNDNDIKTDYMFRLEDFSINNEIYFLSYDNDFELSKKLNGYNYTSNKINNYNGNYKILNNDFSFYLNSGKTVILCLNGNEEIKRIIKYLDIHNYVVTDVNNIMLNKINIISFNIVSGFIFENYVVITRNDLYEIKSKVYHGKTKLTSKGLLINKFNKGDYVVHEEYGIGLYDDLCTIKKNGILKDYIKIKYAGDDVLYIPVENIDRISKFSGRDSSIMSLDKLGGSNWNRKKSRVRKQLNSIAGELIKVSALRETLNGFSFSIEDENQVIFDNGFAYKETKDQMLAISKIKKEMEQPKPMDMLLCGDVGFGKSEVAFRAIFKAVNNGKQVAYLCPTTILSMQQFNSAMERFSSFPVNIALLNRFVTKSNQNKIINDLSVGKIDIVFGTHRLLGDDVKFKDLGLLVVDEEQRFGVKDKEKIKKFKSSIDVLTLSATPIPRTLQLSLTGVRSLALIETPPAERYPIQTYIMEENDIIIKDAIYKELSRHGQVFLLYNHVDSIEIKCTSINTLVPEAKIRYVHGQMEKSQIENIMIDFMDYKFDVLICTTIIETGIDIPNANTLIILEVDHFGLSQLYQIRGRIGRSNKIGYAYLMYKKNKILNETATKRLDAIKEFTELGSGFKIAMRDLSIRGAGDILGREQSGFIDAIGIDLYLKILNEEINKINGNNLSKENDDNINFTPLINIETHIDDTFINDNDLKIEVHRIINTVDSYEKILEVKNVLEDRFGFTSDSLVIYMYEEWFEKMARSLDINNVKQTSNYIDIILSKKILDIINIKDLFTLSYNITPNFRFTNSFGNTHLILDINNLEKHFLIYLTDILNQIINLNK